MIYKEYKTLDGTTAIHLVRDDGSSASFLKDPANTDFVEYQRWLAEGHTPQPADQGEAE